MSNPKPKTSNRKGTGKVHPCKQCSTPTPLYKKYCSRNCYTLSHRVIIKCKKCNKSKSLPKSSKNQIFCSIQCANSYIDRKLTHKKAKQTLKSKYGVENSFEVKGYSNLNIDRELVGIKNKQKWKNKSTQEKNQIKDKIKTSHLNFSDLKKKNIRDKVSKTNLEKYGDTSALGANSILRNKADLNNKHSHINKLKEWLKSNNLELLDEYKGVKTSTGDLIYYKFKHTLSGNIFNDHVACGRLPIYKDPNETWGISNQEKELRSFLNSYISKEDIIFNSRKIVKGFEIDIYIPKFNLAIEYNGLFWHSELKGKTRNYHLNKTEECEKQNIQLIHIFEDEWSYKKDRVKSKILNLIHLTPNKIYARKCELKTISNPIKNKFLEENHLQGKDKSKYKYGLYYNGDLISLITFGKLRKITGNIHKKDTYELIRYATKQNYNIVGGFSKLLKHFIKTHTPTKIISYADRRWSQGKLYEVNGFTLTHNTPPNYWYMKYYKIREHRYRYRKSELKNLLPLYTPSLSEWENMKKNKYDRIWDCGSKKYELNFT